MLIKIRKSRWAKVVTLVMVCFMFSPWEFIPALYATSGGPTPPEYATFQKVSAGDLVDPFTGNVQYSLPLFEIGGYPINLTYSGDINPEQNAGWVGLGWSLQAGSIGRAMRGIPDDFKGDDIKKEINVKPRIIQSYNFQYHNKEGKQVELVGLNGGFSSGGLPTFVHDNYRGFGINYDMNLKFGLFNRIDSIIADTADGWVPPLEVGEVTEIIEFDTTYKDALPILDFNTQYSSYDGNTYNVIPDVGFIEDGINKMLNMDHKRLNFMLSNPAIRFNSQQGLVSMGTVHGRKNNIKIPGLVSNFNHSFLTQSFIPNFNPDMTTRVIQTAFSFSKDFVFVDQRGISVGVTVSTEKMDRNQISKKAFGCLYQDDGEGVEDALLDNQSSPMLMDKYTQRLAPTVSTYDVFNISASGVGGSFKVKYNSLGIVSPPNQKVSTSPDHKIALQLGQGTNWEIAGDIGLRHVIKKTEKWTFQNRAANYLKFKSSEPNSLFETSALRNNFEFIESNTAYQNSIGGLEATRFGLKPNFNKKLAGWRANNTLHSISHKVNTLSSQIAKDSRDPRQQSITYLTAKEAENQGIVRDIRNYKFTDVTIDCIDGYQVDADNSSGKYVLQYDSFSRDALYRKSHHISEINVLQPSGVTYNFGLPVYQVDHKEVSFALDLDRDDRSLDYDEGTSNFFGSGEDDREDATSNVNGIDNFYQEVTTPAYANAFLLTTILSQDYSDLNNDGPTVDDLGSYVKFNYSMPDYDASEISEDAEHHLFNWRAPYKDANWSRGYESDELDDRASFSYGKREQWYMHSIETKDRIAIFELADRADGIGNVGRNGTASASANKQKYLVGVKIFNRKAFEKDGLSASPIREIKMHYSYDLCSGITSFIDPGVSASCNNHPLKDFDPSTYGSIDKYSGGKLTLHMVEFIEGELNMISKDPYVFEYKTLNPDYAYKSVDRWGTYHPVNLYEEGGVSNQRQIRLANHPYTYQDKDSQDLWSSAWMLSDITLPSGSKISLDYEADDYGYVQNKQAMTMLKINGIRETLEGADGNTLYGDDQGLEIEAGNGVLNLGDVKKPNLYITFEKESGKLASDYVPKDDILFFSFNVNLARREEPDAYEQISGYFTIEEYGDIPSTDLGYIKVKHYDLGKTRSAKIHPVTKMAFQYAFSNLPHLMNPKGYTKRSSGLEKIEDAVSQMVGIIPEYIKSLTGASAYFQALGHAQEVELNRSYLRLNEPSKTKLGGGHRVKKVTVSDVWDVMTKNQEGEASYSTLYSYQTTDPKTNDSISSGVAIYEPFVGGEENPFKMPINYSAYQDVYIKKREGIYGAVTIGYDLGPIGEDFFPGPGVGYSKITIQSDVPNANIVRHLAGRTEYEFFTAYDFPTKSSMTTIDKEISVFSSPGLHFDNIDDGWRDDDETEPDGEAFNINSVTGLPKTNFGLDVKVKLGYAAALQGYLIEQNDMHGKPKSVKTFKPNAEDAISSTTYHYKVDAKGALVNTVNVLREDGTFEQAQMGVQMDPTIYAYRTVEINQDGAIAPNFNIGSPAPVPVMPSLFGAYAYYSNDSRVMIMTKQVYRNGILDSVVVEDKGAHTFTENLAWDPVTGKVLLTKAKDEFNDAVYSLSKPAYWMNSSLAGAYKNIGLVVEVELSGGGEILNPQNALQVGDVLVENDFSSSDKYWVLDRDETDGTVRLIDALGDPITFSAGEQLRVFRSGHRNLLNLGAETIVLQNNPLNEGTDRWDEVEDWDKVISASAIDYNDIRHQLYLMDYCMSSTCDTVVYELGTGDLTTFGYGFRNTPSEYSSVFNFEYESLSKHRQAGEFYGKPSWCTCDEFGGGSVPPGEGSPPGGSDCDLCNRWKYEESDTINPFVYGLRGIWRPASEIVYFEKRNAVAQRIQNESTSGNPNTTDIREAGYLDSFKAYWNYNQGTSKWEKNSTQHVYNPWTWKDSVTKTDFFGNDLESVSALNGIKNAVLYDYERKVPVAMANNAEYHEVLFDGFEDYSTDAYVEFNCDSLVANNLLETTIKPSWSREICESYRHWRAGDALIGGTNRISNQQSHTGNNSLMLGFGETEISLDNADIGQASSTRTSPMEVFELQENDFANNFYLKPTATDTFILTFWVKEAFDDQFEIGMKKLDGSLLEQYVPLFTETASVHVNGWEKITVKFGLAANEQLFKVILTNKYQTGEPIPMPCYIDDIMIYPADAVMSAYVYDRDKKRLMAGLNPNNFATFYEYDEEGNLERQKVETDRGIMTIGENRQSLKR